MDRNLPEGIAKFACEFNLEPNNACEKCNTTGELAFFLSDGGLEPRDGTYLCQSCLMPLLVTEDDRDAIRHAIGLNSTPHEDRNFFFADCRDPQMLRLVGLGLMREGREAPGGQYFIVTSAGAEFVNAPKSVINKIQQKERMVLAQKG